MGATREANTKWGGKYRNAQSTGTNKPGQGRHVKFLGSYPGGIDGLMRDHAALIAPKFRAVGETLRAELGEGDDFATWANPQGGYFISLDTTAPVAARVVELADAAGVSLTPAGATYPDGKDPGNRNIRTATTRPPVRGVYIAMSAGAACIRLGHSE